MSTERIARGGFWVYVGSVASNALGYVYWLLASRLVYPSTIGSASAVLASQGLIMAFVSLGLPTGIRRFFGAGSGKSDYQQVTTYFYTSFAIAVVLNVPVSVALLIASYASIGVFGLTPFETQFIAIFLLLNFFFPILVSLFDSLLRTKVTAIAQIVGTIVKLAPGFLLLLLGLDFLGIMLAFTVSSLAADLLLLHNTRNLFRSCRVQHRVDRSLVGEILRSGLPAWIPNTLTIAGQSVGVLLIYHFVGSSETGLYYISFAVASIVYALPASILSLVFPVLSGMADGKKRMASSAVRMSLVLTTPAAALVAAYPSVPLLLLGPAYSQAYPILTALVLGAIVYPVYAGYYSYAYAIGKYVHVTILGLALNLSRLFLYAILVSTLGALGISFGYTLGIVIALAFMIPSARRVGFMIDWKAYSKAIAIPSVLVLLLLFANVPWYLGIPLTLVGSLVTYTRLAVITKSEARGVLQACFSSETLDKAYPRLRSISRLLFGD